ncbi:hypothetical protein ACWEHA_43250, partial [Amycolatopsis nivea]
MPHWGFLSSAVCGGFPVAGACQSAAVTGQRSAPGGPSPAEVREGLLEGICAHTRLRRVIAGEFGRGHVQRLRPMVAELAES